MNTLPYIISIFLASVFMMNVVKGEPVMVSAEEVETLDSVKDFNDFLVDDFDRAHRWYNKFESTKGGRVLNSDYALMLYGPYNDGLEGANRFSSPIYKPAKEFVERLFRVKVESIAESYGAKREEVRSNAELEEKSVEQIEDLVARVGKPSIMFLAGGTASGKSTVIERTSKVFDNADLVYDGTFRNEELSRTKVRFALDHGFKVVVVYVYRPVELAVEGMLKRALKNGRTVPILFIAESHSGAQSTFRGLFKDRDTICEEYRKTFGRDRCEIEFIPVINRGGLMDIKVSVPNEFLNSLKNETKEQLMLRALSAYCEFDKTGFSEDAISTFEDGIERACMLGSGKEDL